MTATATPIDRRRRVAARSWWIDSLEGAVYLAAAGAVAFMIAGGGLVTFQAIDWVYALGRIVGIVATVFVLAQVLLVSRAPYIERSMGHDRTVALHTRLGKWAILLMLAHATIIISVSAVYDGMSVVSQTTAFFTQAWYLATAQIGLVLFLVVLITSLMIVRRRWRYETWHTVHVLVYVAVALVVPHQFLFGTTFASGGAAWWYWLALYVFAFGSLFAFRLARPLVVLRQHRLAVAGVETLPDGSTSVLMTGRNLDRLRPAAGQFFLWRFLARGYWTQAHPFSLSSQPDGSMLRITVKPSGDFSASLGRLQPGTRVLAEGPLGVFSNASRATGGLVLVAAGIGITPIRAMLEEYSPGDGPCDVIVRARGLDDAPLLDEIRALAAERDVPVHVLTGSRGDGWAPASAPATLADLVPDVAQRDVFICGPLEWARQVEADALAAGCAKEAVHRERFGW